VFLASLPPVEGVSLLPFHTFAKDKHRKFGVAWRLASNDEIPADRIAAWAARIGGGGVRVTVGG
jgi:hypothetical protein